MSCYDLKAHESEDKVTLTRCQSVDVIPLGVMTSGVYEEMPVLPGHSP